ncbi:proprotein convertase subtilisin/kexin type 1 inhibitor, like [Amphiprion ocellaris]|uniref:proprotein convertase subtilisin/kexin type 1 inhibitor, like n=1 Tax=Amphiprion ocellaris TaxID=80972 RepID=UPI000C311401|nr:proprotein convertase subtilisin/kexin type 1 inhibitor, like [Amphiprion ocellaris]
MASLSLLLLSAALIHNAQPLPADRDGGRGLDLSVGGVRRQRGDLRNLLPYDDQRGGGANDLYYQSDDWRGRGLDHALHRLVEKDQRREQEEEQRAAYLAALLRLLSEAENAGLVGPGDVEVVEVVEEEDEGPEPPDYDETGRGLSMGRPPALWWGLLEPQLAQALLDRMEPQLVQKLLDRARQERLQQDGRVMSREQDMLRHLVARILSSIGPSDAPLVSGRRMRRDLSAGEPVSSAHRRTRRSLDDVPSPSPSNDPPLLRVKRLEDDEDEQKLRPHAAGLQRMKRIDTMATADELNHGSRRRQRRAALNYDPQELLDQIVQYLRE